MSNLAKHSEILFMWDARMCNPNGDMASDNAPRFDDVDEKAIVSDVRIKRTIRDDLQYRKGEMIYINNDEILAKGLSAEDRFEEIKKQRDLIKESLDVFLSCIDNRLFGGVAPKSNIQLVGPVQFSWTKSLNKTETVLKPGTGAFATKSKEDGKTKNTKTFRADNYIPYGLFAMYGTINSLQAMKAKTTEEDIHKMLDSLWFGTKLLNTRSKEGQKSRLLMRIVYKKNYFIGLLDELVKLKNEDSELIRQIHEAEIDFSELVKAVKKAENYIEYVKIVLDDSLEAYKEEFKEIKNVNIMDEMEFVSSETQS